MYQIMMDFLYTNIKDDWSLMDSLDSCCIAFRKGSNDHADGWIKYIDLYQQVLEHLDGHKSPCFLLKKAYLNEAFPA